jgi:flagellar export protein FliJ
MKALDTLIRLRQQTLDRQRQALAALRSRRDGIDQEAAALETQLVTEQALAASEPDLMFSYGGFARKVIDERARLAHLADELDGEIDAAIGEVRVAFTELRKFEIARDHRLQREHDERERTEQKAVDDLTITRLHHRSLQAR